MWTTSILLPFIINWFHWLYCLIMVDIVFSRGLRGLRRMHSLRSCCHSGQSALTSRTMHYHSSPWKGKSSTPIRDNPTYLFVWFYAFALSGRQVIGILQTQGVGSRCSPCPGLCAFGLSGRNSSKKFTPPLSLWAKHTLHCPERPHERSKCSPWNLRNLRENTIPRETKPSAG